MPKVRTWQSSIAGQRRNMEVHPSFPAKSVSEFIAYVKANPGPSCLPAKLWHHDAHAVPLNAIQRCPKSQGLLVEDGRHISGPNQW